MRSRPKPTRNRAATTTADSSGERLQKVLAAAGIGSRRKCEELIAEGRVEVDRQVAGLGTKVNTLTQEIRVDGEALRRSKAQYFLVNKPEGVLSTSYDQQHRTRVIDLVDTHERLFTVGRLDQYSEGLILVTNDGELANRLTHPRYGAEKTYLVVAAGEITPETLLKLKKGVHLAEGVAKVASLKIRKARRQSTELEMILQEGKNRELRRILAAVGHKVLKLKRTQIGPLKLGELPVGAHRPLTSHELDALQEYAYSSRLKKQATQEASKPLAAKVKSAVVKKPVVAKEDVAFEEEEYSGPVLVNEELTHFDDRTFKNDSWRAKSAGAVIAFDDDEQAPSEEPPKPTTPVPSALERPRKKFGKPKGSGVRAGGRNVGGRNVGGQKKFAKGTRSETERTSGPKGAGGRTGGKKFAKGERRDNDRSGAPRKFAKKHATKKGRR